LNVYDKETLAIPCPMLYCISMPEKLKTQYYRWMKIDDEIRKGRYPSAVDLACMLEVSVKTIRRDIEYLRVMLDAPIEYDASRKGLYYSSDDFHLGSVRVTGSEYLAMLLSSRVFSQYRNTPYYKSLGHLFGKMKDFLAEQVEIDPDLFETTVLFFGGPLTAIKEVTWSALMKAIREKQAVSFSYGKPGAETPSSYTLEVYRVVGYRGDWYCVGKCRERKAVRIYSMARMSNIKSAGNYAIPKSFRLEDYVRGSFGMFLEEREYTVKIEFDPDSAPFIRERVWGAKQKIEELPGGRIRLSFTAGSLVELSMWVLSHGSHAKVISPPELVEMVRTEIDGMRKKY